MRTSTHSFFRHQDSPNKVGDTTENCTTVDTRPIFSVPIHSVEQATFSKSRRVLTSSTEYSPGKPTNLLTEPDARCGVGVDGFPKRVAVAKRIQLRPQSTCDRLFSRKSDTNTVVSRGVNTATVRVDIPTCKRGCSLSPRADKAYVQQNAGDGAAFQVQLLTPLLSAKRDPKVSGSPLTQSQPRLLKLHKSSSWSSLIGSNFDLRSPIYEDDKHRVAATQRRANLQISIGQRGGKPQQDFNLLAAPTIQTLTVPNFSMVSMDQLSSMPTQRKDSGVDANKAPQRTARVSFSDHSEIEWLAPDSLVRKPSRQMASSGPSELKLDTAVDLQQLLNESRHFQRFLAQKLSGRQEQT